MSASKPFWLEDPDPSQTSVRFCCPYCFNWIRNREFEEHVKSAHHQIFGQSTNSGRQSVSRHGKDAK